MGQEFKVGEKVWIPTYNRPDYTAPVNVIGWIERIKIDSSVGLPKSFEYWINCSGLKGGGGTFYNGWYREKEITLHSHPTKAHEALLPITREDLFKYAEECKDKLKSVVVRKYYGHRGVDLIGRSDTVETWVDSSWTHTEPTLPGFIEWLKGKKK
jgi:hypothetical protein